MTSLKFPTANQGYEYKPEDTKDVKNLKTMQRQMDFNTIIEQNPVLIGTNPRILSVDTQPRIDIITSNGLRRESNKKHKNNENIDAEN